MLRGASSQHLFLTDTLPFQYFHKRRHLPHGGNRQLLDRRRFFGRELFTHLLAKPRPPCGQASSVASDTVGALDLKPPRNRFPQMMGASIGPQRNPKVRECAIED